MQYSSPTCTIHLDPGLIRADFHAGFFSGVGKTLHTGSRPLLGVRGHVLHGNLDAVRLLLRPQMARNQLLKTSVSKTYHI